MDGEREEGMERRMEGGREKDGWMERRTDGDGEWMERGGGGREK